MSDLSQFYPSKVVQTGTDSAGVSRTAGYTAPASNSQNIPAAAVAVLNQFEGQSIEELLAQILLEIRISNQMQFNATEMLINALKDLQTGKSVSSVSALDEPAAYRNDPTLFN